MMRRRSSRNRPSGRWWLMLVLMLLGWLGWDDLRLGLPPSPKREATKVFEVLLDARLHPHRDNDGDSFHLEHGGQIHEFRLYFADCPEKARHHLNGDRLADQGRYFGGLSESETVAVGQAGEAFTQDWLNRQRFTVCTKWQAVFGSGRYYAFVLFDDGEDLSAKLVRAGLARIHTGGTTLPDGRGARVYEQQLRALEYEARAARHGAWGMR